nr:caspase-8-like [Hydra vulgaris]
MGIFEASKFRNEKYIFKSNPCGICVIISNNFSNTKIERKGTKIDLDRLDKTFSKLNFKVIKKEDKTDKEIYQIIEKYGKKKVDCFVCCILSHGDEEKVFGNDNSPLTFNEMRSAISKNQENLLKGKPKIFFIQACQGPNAANQYVESDSINQYVESDLREELNLTENEDFYFSVCTTPGLKYLIVVLYHLLFEDIVRMLDKALEENIAFLLDDSSE